MVDRNAATIAGTPWTFTLRDARARRSRILSTSVGYGHGEARARSRVARAKRIFRGSNPRKLKRHLTKSRLVKSCARGKQMLFRFSNGGWLGLHLGMSGTMRIEGAAFTAEKHDHLVLRQATRAPGVSRSAPVWPGPVPSRGGGPCVVVGRDAGNRLTCIQRDLCV